MSGAQKGRNGQDARKTVRGARRRAVGKASWAELGTDRRCECRREIIDAREFGVWKRAVLIYI